MKRRERLGSIDGIAAIAAVAMVPLQRRLSAPISWIVSSLVVTAIAALIPRHRIVRLCVAITIATGLSCLTWVAYH